MQEFVDGLERYERPTLSFLHVLLPHHPWEYLPNGKIYAANLGYQPGMVDEGWTGDPELAMQAMAAAPAPGGLHGPRARADPRPAGGDGLYDEALVVVVADHGVSFRPHGERRRVQKGNLEEIAFVPLFVKPPGQTDGEVVDEHVRSDGPRAHDGRHPRRRGCRGRRTAARSWTGAGEEPTWAWGPSSGEVVVGDDDELVERRDRVLAHQIDLFGEGDEEPGLYAVGPRPELLDRPLDGLAGASGGGADLRELRGEHYDPDSPLAPVRVYGRIRGAPGSQDVAIAVNGRSSP